jgi:hypothetical protein
MKTNNTCTECVKPNHTYTEQEVKEIVRQTIDKTCTYFHENLKVALANDIYDEVRKKEPKIFYRVCNQVTHRGMWYDYQGVFTGLIHDKEFDFCLHKDLEMEFDKDLVGWLSATDTLDKLFEWFPKEEIIKLQSFGWFIHEFEAIQYKFYDPFQHMIIEQKTSKMVKKIIL